VAVVAEAWKVAASFFCAIETKSFAFDRLFDGSETFALFCAEQHRIILQIRALCVCHFPDIGCNQSTWR
jgi:hypothetical protein